MADNVSLSRPPLNVLIDPKAARRRSPWEINLTELLDMFLKAIVKPDIIDLRAAGLAALSSATIYRLKVESLFLFEKLRAQRKTYDASEPPQIIVMPFRYEVYSTNVEELFDELARILEQIVSEQSGAAEGSPLPVDELEPPNIDDYVVQLQSMLSGFRAVLLERLGSGKAMLSELLAGFSRIDAARVFIMLLFAAHSGEVVINQEEDEDDALVVSVGQLE